MFELLLQRQPGVVVREEAVLDGMAKLDELFFNCFAHFAGGRRAEGCHLTVPAAGEVLPQVHETCKLAQGLKVLRETRAGILDLCCFDEVAPSLVSEKREGTELASTFEMDEDFASNAFLILKRMFIRKLRAEFEERFPGVSSFAMNAADEANQFVPGLAVRVNVLASGNSGELPLVFSGKRIDGLGHDGSKGFQLIGRAF